MDSLVLGNGSLTLEDVASVARSSRMVSIGPRGVTAMQTARAVVDRVLAASDPPTVYGVNTGFGALAAARVSPGQLCELQRNLVRSHAAGVGHLLNRDEVRAIMLLRAHVLSHGHSGVRPELCTLLCEMLNRGVHPSVPSRGSVGASGDLVPLAHVALCLIGEGEVELAGERVATATAFGRVGLEPLILQAKEGLSLVNGTEMMTALGALALHDGFQTALAADIAGALSCEALHGNDTAFDARVSAVRPHPGQVEVAARLRALLGAGGRKQPRHPRKVQDAYSLRCMPQVHGASLDVLRYARTVLEVEANSVTDNPLVFSDGSLPFGGDIVSGGNFHGQPLAIAMDAAAIGLAELASISERRLEQALNPQLSNGLPPFLTQPSGLRSGFMMLQVSAAALVSENKILCHPAAVDSIPLSAGQEDHVSMGATAALKLRQVGDNVRNVIAMELLGAARALDFRAHTVASPAVRAVHRCIRNRIPFVQEDAPLHGDIAALRALIDDGSIVGAAVANLQ